MFLISKPVINPPGKQLCRHGRKNNKQHWGAITGGSFNPLVVLHLRTKVRRKPNIQRTIGACTRPEYRQTRAADCGIFALARYQVAIREPKAFTQRIGTRARRAFLLE